MKSKRFRWLRPGSGVHGRAIDEALADAHVERQRAHTTWKRVRSRAATGAAVARIALGAAFGRDGLFRRGFMDRLQYDLAYSWRRLWRTPGFTVLAIVTLALGIGVNTALFSLVHNFVFKALPIPALSEMVGIDTVRPRSGLLPPFPGGLTDDEARPLEHMVETHDMLASLARTTFVHGALSTGTDSVVIVGEAVSGGYFNTTGVAPLLGRVLSPADDRPEAGGEIVLSEHTWRRMFDGNPAAIGRTVRLTGQVLTIVGVAPDSFHGVWLPAMLHVDAWVPLRDWAVLDASHVGAPGTTRTPALHPRLLARLRPGATVAQLSSRIAALGQHIAFEHGETGLVVEPARDLIVPAEFDQPGRMMGVALITLSALVLVIACSNLTNLVLARTASRTAEVAVRMASGASRGRIAQLFLLETMLLTAAAGAIGLGVATLTARALAAIPLPDLDGIAIRYEPSLDLHVFGYGLALALVAALAIGIVPAWRATKTDPIRVFANAGGVGGASPRGGRLRTTLLAVQIGASTVLLLVAGLYVRSALARLENDPGIDVTHTVMGEFNLTYSGYDEAHALAFFRRLDAVASTTPELVSTALTSSLPVGTSRPQIGLLAEGEAPVQTTYGPSGHGCFLAHVSPGLFRTLGVALLRGRDFTPADTSASLAVVILNESAAARLWPRQDPIGRRVTLRMNGPLLTVVGVVADTDRSARVRNAAFTPLLQDYTPQVILVGRGRGDGALLVDVLRTTARQADPAVAIYDVGTVESYAELWLNALRLAASVLATLGALGGLIAIIGMYGVSAYIVSLRTREFGILKALGASGPHIYRSVLAQGARALALGVVPGLFVSALLSTLLRRLLVGVGSNDPLPFVIVPVVLMVVGLAASMGPARRAAAVDPNVALREL